MTAGFDEFNDDNDPNEGQSDFRRQQRNLEKKAKERDEAVKRAEQAERRLAFIEAGIDPKRPGVDYFMKGYEGEATSEKIREAALAAGFLDKPEDKPEDKETEQVQDQKPEQQGIPGEQQIPGVQQFTDEQMKDIAGLQAMGLAGNIQATEGTSHFIGLEQAAKAGGAEAIAAYMRQHGLPVTEDQY